MKLKLDLTMHTYRTLVECVSCRNSADFMLNKMFPGIK